MAYHRKTPLEAAPQAEPAKPRGRPPGSSAASNGRKKGDMMSPEARAEQRERLHSDTTAIPFELTEEGSASLPVTRLHIKPPNFQILEFHVEGTAPLVQHAFPQKTRIQMEEKHRAGSAAKNARKREARNFEAEVQDAMHVATKKDGGWVGVPASALRAAAISACRVAGFPMTRMKLCVFIIAQGYDRNDQQPLIQLIADPPRSHRGMVRNETGVVDVRWRPMFEKWSLVFRIYYDADQFNEHSMVNLMNRAGMQVGIGEGRPDSPQSNGLGWGTFRVRKAISCGQMDPGFQFGADMAQQEAAAPSR